jgi:hypothetical protein
MLSVSNLHIWRRIRGEHGKELLRQREELLERSFAHAYE